MARVNLSEQLAKRVGSRTKIKYDESGKRVGGGTKITESLVSKVRADEAGLVEIREDNSEQIANAINQAVAAALEEIGLAAERFAKRETPVDTGRLRNSITHAINMDEEAVYVGTNVDYAPYIEFGTHGRDGHHMLAHAASNHGDFYRGILEKHLKSGG